jgi:hypothetical protein
MSFDPRDVIWEKIFDVYYDSYWVEILSDNIIGFWQKTDDITKVLVALTVSGWTLWNQPGFKYIWAILAGISAVLSITHAALGVAGKVRDWTEIKRQFTTLRLELESSRDLMEINPNFSIEDFENQYKAYKKRYGELYSSIQNDIILSKSRKVKCQNNLNIRLELVYYKKNNL